MGFRSTAKILFKSQNIKVLFWCVRMEYLGHIAPPFGIAIDPEKTKYIDKC